MSDIKTKLLVVEDLPLPAQSAMRPSLLFPNGRRIQAGDFSLEIVSTNDNKGTVTLRVVGVFIEDNAPNETNN